MKRARVHKYEQASRREEAELEAQTTRRGVDWEERGPLVVGRLSHTPNHSSPAWRCCVYVPNGEDDTNGCVLRYSRILLALKALQTFQTPNAPHTETD